MNLQNWRYLELSTVKHTKNFGEMVVRLCISSFHIMYLHGLVYHVHICFYVGDRTWDIGIKNVNSKKEDEVLKKSGDCGKILGSLGSVAEGRKTRMWSVGMGFVFVKSDQLGQGRI